jgi:hypothetical protein
VQRQHARGAQQQLAVLELRLHQRQTRHSRWVSISPCGSTTIQARSKSSPVSTSWACCSAMPAQDLIG